MSEPQNGRIGGGVLADNLLRQGIDLNFKNTVADTALLHFDVNTSKIGINTEIPLNDLQVLNTFQTVNQRATFFNIANLSIDNSQIVSNVGDLNLTAGSNIQLSSLATNNIRINDNSFFTSPPNTNLEIRPAGIGTLEIFANWNVTGAIHATGNVTFGGNLTVGDNSNDNLIFDAEINSNIVPDQSNTYSIGSSSKRWGNLYSNLLNGQQVDVGTIIVGDASLALRQGNIFYVSTNGDDTNVGDHQHGPFRTIRHALEVADASSGGPVTIHIFPGEYEETLPLIVPERVNIHGEDIRNTIIKPDTASEAEDVFLLNQNCTIENITIKDFYYDSINDTGYAFKFAPGAIIAERSPYVRNVSVITRGSITSLDDPGGFASGDAGKGAMIDGAVLNNQTLSASMLFHSATFITPGVDAITMKNGVRVEWLNSFTYFANRGLYAQQGSGRVLSDGSSLEFGAEIRSIGSACVYGNFGAVADGANTLMYLIGHNFAYIGTGKDVSNDKTLVLQDQEVVEINNGKIYYVSLDGGGVFRVGDAFYVDFETGSTSIDVGNIDFSGVSSIFINTGGSVCYIDGSRIDLGNFRFSTNTIETLENDFEFTPVTGFLYLDDNPVFILPNGTTIQRKSEQSDLRFNTSTNKFEGFDSAHVSFGGVYSDDRRTSVSATNVLGDIVFVANNIETGRISGNAGGRWELNGLTTDNIIIDNNFIRTYESNSNLEFRTTGLGVKRIFDLELVDNNIDNITSNNFTMKTTGRGYLKFDTSLGFLVPSGDTAARPGVPQTGMTRWNTEEQYMETYNGVEWQRSAGTGAEVTQAVMEEILETWTLILG